MHYKKYKKILSNKNSMNIYRGCTHGCIYCDSRSECYQMKHSFEDIEVKEDAHIILENELRKKRKKSMVATGSMSDPYLHIEQKLELTRKCISVIEKYGFGLCILTKSDTILRDLDILKSINKKSKCVVQMTLTTYDESLCKKLEPNVSTTKERVDVLNIIKNEGIPTIVWLGPLLPYINDTEENIKGLLKYCVDAGVKGVVFFGVGVTMRSGNREYFYKNLDKLFPNMKNEYIQNFGDSYVCGSKNYESIRNIVVETCERNNIMYNPKEVFEYLNKFEEKEMCEQISLFDY